MHVILTQIPKILLCFFVGFCFVGTKPRHALNKAFFTFPYWVNRFPSSNLHQNHILDSMKSISLLGKSISLVYFAPISLLEQSEIDFTPGEIDFLKAKFKKYKEGSLTSFWHLFL